MPLQLSSAFDAAQESNATDGSCYESAGDSFSRSREASRCTLVMHPSLSRMLIHHVQPFASCATHGMMVQTLLYQLRAPCIAHSSTDAQKRLATGLGF